MVNNVKNDLSLGLVFFTVMLTVYGQLVVKWRVRQAGALPLNFTKKVVFLADLMLDPWIISGIVAAFLAGLSWMAAMTKFELSYAYPFTSLAFVLVLLLSVVLFHETITAPKLLGVIVVVVGVIIASQG